MTLEMGKPLTEALGEVAYGGEFLRWFSEEAVRVEGRYGPSPEGTGRMVVTQHPVGPCFLITPWDFPLAMATRKIAPALAAGCTVVVKPAALTPLTTLYFAKLLADAGLPSGVVNVVTTSASGPLSEAMIADPRLRKLSFTGSTPIGQKLLRQAAGGVLRTSMELGGNAPFVVFADADLDKSSGRRAVREVPQHWAGVHGGEPVPRAASGGRGVHSQGRRTGAGLPHRTRHRGRGDDRAADRRPGSDED